MKEKIPLPFKEFLRPLWSIYQLIYMFAYDACRYVRYSGVFRKNQNLSSMGAFITKRYHMIEKGLALPQPRAGFGEDNIKELCSLTTRALQGGTNVNEVSLSADALEGYRSFNLKHQIQPQPWLVSTIDCVRLAGIPQGGNPVKEVNKTDLDGMNPLDVIMTRASVRDFAGTPVPDVVLENAVRAAQQAPSVCNRQAGRIYLLRDPKVKEIALSFQNGNRGFGDKTPVVAIITMDQAEMLEPMERYQHWIDGGMFAENFLLGIHAQGYGACPLNWSAQVKSDLGIRKALGFISGSEAIIMLVAVGALNDRYKVARSERRPISQVMRVH